MRNHSDRARRRQAANRIPFSPALNQRGRDKDIRRTKDRSYDALCQAAYARQQEMADEMKGKRPDS